MIRKIIVIDQEKCSGCGLCAAACHEGAIGMVEGKAQLLREDYCDGLGDCLPACPVDAISFEYREAPAYNEAAVLAAKAGKPREAVPAESRLQNFPVQIRLVPVVSPMFADADLLIAADCTAYAYGDFHSRFIRGRTTLIGCPKLDEGDYADKLTEILRQNTIRSVTLVRMQVPCCGGLTRALQTAIQRSGRDIPLETYIITPEGTVLGE